MCELVMKLTWRGAYLACTGPRVIYQTVHKLGMVEHACNPSTWWGCKQEVQKFKAIT